MRSRLRIPLAALAAALAGCVPPAPYSLDAAETPALVAVDWREVHQTIVGFGGTMGWIHPHPERRREVFDLLFKQLGASVLRIRALGGEAGDEDSIEPENDDADPNSFNWSRFKVATSEAKNAVIIKAALERGVKTVIPTAWSPPGWMKTTGRRAGGGELEEKHLAEYAEAWAAYVIGMKRHFGIDTKYLSIQNEPDLRYYYPTCAMEPGPYAKAAAAVAARLAKEKLPVTLAGPDTCRIYHLPEYLRAMARAKVPPGTSPAPVLTHLYDLGIGYGKPEADPKRWRAARELARRHKRPLWLTEAANYLSHGVEKGSYAEAIIWAQKIHHALVSGDCEVVCYWSLYFDKRGEALVYAAESEARRFEITPKFWTSMNYYRFVRPGMLRCSARSSGRRLLVSAFRDPDSRRRVIVIVNTSDRPARVRLPFAARETWLAYVTSAAEKCHQSVACSRTMTLDPRSVTTLVHERPAAAGR